MTTTLDWDTTPLTCNTGGSTNTRTYTCNTCDTDITITVTILWKDDLNGFTTSNLHHLTQHLTTCKATK